MNSSWGYREDNQWKSPETLIRSLVDIASMGGNLLLNVGPKPDGTFPEESIHRLEEIGEWMRVNGEAIYGTKASPMGRLTWGRCTEKELQKKTRLYFFIYDWPEDSRLRIPELMNQIVSVRLLSTGEKLKTSLTNNELIINLSDVTPDKYVNVIRLDIKGKIEKSTNR
jgi:alpha-L-fucosidase